MITKVVSVARWEYLEKVKSKAFLIGLFLTPILMVGLGVVTTLLITRADTRTKIIGVIDPSGAIVTPLADLVQARYRLADGSPNYVIRPLAVGRAIRGPADVLDHATTEVGIGTKLGIDATRKWPGEGFKREWPPLIKMDEAVKKKIDAFLSAGGGKA